MSPFFCSLGGKNVTATGFPRLLGRRHKAAINSCSVRFGGALFGKNEQDIPLWRFGSYPARNRLIRPLHPTKPQLLRVALIDPAPKSAPVLSRLVRQETPPIDNTDDKANYTAGKHDPNPIIEPLG